MIATRSPGLLTALLVSVAAVACSSGASPTAQVPESPPEPIVTASPTATSTPVPAPTSSAIVPQSGTELVPPTQLPASPTPVIIPALKFVDNSDCQGISRNQLSLADVEITDGTRSVSLVAEMAISSTDQSQGLMCRETVPGGTGMLFIWEEERNGGFWMFNTYAPLDIIYFGASDGGVALRQMTPCPRRDGEATAAWNSRCGQESTPYRPGILYTTTLELPQGWLVSQGFDSADPSDIVVSLTTRD